MNFGSTNGFKFDPNFYPLYTNFASYFIARFRRRTPANGTRPNFAKRWTVNHANKNSWGRPPPKKWGQKLLHLFGFSTISTLNGEYPLNEKWLRQLGKGVGKYKGLLHCPKISQTFVHKRLKNAEWSFTVSYYFLPSQSISHPLSGINVAPRSDSKRNGIGFVCSSDSRPQNMFSWKCGHVWWP